MKIQTLTLGALALAAAVFASPLQQGSSASCCGGMMSMQHDQHQASASTPAKLVKGVQKATVTIANGKYSPSQVSVVKGKPVELTFRGGKNMGCGSTVVFKSLKQSKDIPSGKSVVIKFTPKEVGTIEFTCGMGMYDGKVIVK